MRTVIKLSMKNKDKKVKKDEKGKVGKKPRNVSVHHGSEHPVPKSSRSHAAKHSSPSHHGSEHHSPVHHKPAEHASVHHSSEHPVPKSSSSHAAKHSSQSHHVHEHHSPVHHKPELRVLKRVSVHEHPVLKSSNSHVAGHSSPSHHASEHHSPVHHKPELRVLKRVSVHHNSEHPVAEPSNSHATGHSSPSHHVHEHPLPVHNKSKGHVLKNAPAHIRSVFSALKLSKSHAAKHSLPEYHIEKHTGLSEASKPLAPYEPEHFVHEQVPYESSSERSDLEISSSEEGVSEFMPESHSIENHDLKQSEPVDSGHDQSDFENDLSKDKVSEPVSGHDSHEDNGSEQVSHEDVDTEQHASEVLLPGHETSDSASESHDPSEHDSKESAQEESDTEQADSEESVPKKDVPEQPVPEQSVLEEPESPFENTQLENNKKAMDIFRGAKRYLHLNELVLAQENVDEAISIDTMDDDNYNRADAYFLAMQICRRAKEYSMALDYIEEGIKSVNPYRGDGPKFVLAKGVILLQVAEVEQSTSKREKYIDSAIESFKMAVSVSDVLLSRKSKYHFDANEVITIKKYQQMAIFNLAYAHDIGGHRREAIASLDRLFELYPHFRVEKTPFELYNKILAEKKVLHIAK